MKERLTTSIILQKTNYISQCERVEICFLASIIQEPIKLLFLSATFYALKKKDRCIKPIITGNSLHFPITKTAIWKVGVAATTQLKPKQLGFRTAFSNKPVFCNHQNATRGKLYLVNINISFKYRDKTINKIYIFTAYIRHKLEYTSPVSSTNLKQCVDLTVKSIKGQSKW